MLEQELLPSLLKQAWANHCYEANAFPREMFLFDHEAKRHRFFVESLEQFLCVTESMFGKYSCYTSVNSKHAQENQLFSKIYVDIDAQETPSKTLEEAFESAKKFEQACPYVVLYFTGNGFSVYIPFEVCRLNHYHKTIRAYVERLEQEYKIVGIDWKVIGDINRVSRIVYTPNMKNGKMCIPVKSSWSLEEILQTSMKCKEIINPFDIELLEYNVSVQEELLEIDSNQKPDNITPFEAGKFESSKDRYIAEVNSILSCACNVLDGRHTLIFHGIIPRLILVGKSDQEILGVVKEFIERTPYDPEKKSVDHYVEYARRDIIATRDRFAKGLPVRLRLDKVFVSRPELLEFFKVNGE